MKRIVCELCGGSNFLKEEGVFVCQDCGCKYSIDEAKRMIVESTEDVPGIVNVDSSDKLKNVPDIVNVDSSDKLKNLYTLARRAKEDGNSQNAAKYYEQIVIEDPNSWEAAFYGVYYTAMNCTIGQIASAAVSVDNCIGSTFKLIKEYVAEEDQKAAYTEVYNKTTELAGVMCNGAIDHYSKYRSVDSAKSELQQRMSAVLRMMVHLGDQVNSVFDDKDLAILAYKFVLKLAQGAPQYHGLSSSEVNSIIDRISSIDPSFEAPIVTSGEGCYIATCVYGSYECPQVWTLRRYRDYTLARTWYGRAFIHTYYAISPCLVKCFGHTEWFKHFWKDKLDRMVANLQDKGVEDTPYKDRTW